MRGGGGGERERKKHTEEEFIRFLPAQRFGATLRWRGTIPKATPKTRKHAEIRFKHSRGGPIAEQTTGDRKEKIGDHKEDLRQKPHDRRRQSTYLHAVPERRCPSIAGP